MKKLSLLIGAAVVGALGITGASAQSGIPAAFKIETQEAVSKVQFKLPFGMSAKKVRENLRKDGYEEIDITKLGVISANVEACRQGKRYRMKIRIDGRYDRREEIGKCRKAIAANDVGDILRKEGFRRVDVQDDGRLPYAATGCRRGDRYNIRISEFGEVKVGKQIGPCRRAAKNRISPRDLRLALRKDGYNRIKFTDRSERRFTVEACNKQNRRIRLTVNRRGRIRDQERIGRCSPRVQANDIPAMLRKDGLNRIEVVDSKPPRYRAEACDAKNNRIRVSISPWGDKINQRKVGKCNPPASVANLMDRLRDSKKFKGIKVRAGKRHPFVATLCDEGKRREVYFSRWGEPEGGKDLGRCVSKRISQVINSLRDEGVRRTKVYVEGCRADGRRYRYSFDEFGDRVDRERIGRCN